VASGDVGSSEMNGIKIPSATVGAEFQAFIVFNENQTANFAPIETYYNDYYGAYV
jgi:hypothetical protein